MGNMKLPYFGEIDLEDLVDFYEAETEFNSHPLSVEVDFEGEDPTKKQLETVKQFLTRLPELNEKALAAIRADFANGSGFVVEFINFFQDSLDGSGEHASFIDESNTEKSVDEQLLEHLYLSRVGLYPTGGAFAILDYIISSEHSDDILVVYLTEDGELDGMTIES